MSERKTSLFLRKMNFWRFKKIFWCVNNSIDIDTKCYSAFLCRCLHQDLWTLSCFYDSWHSTWGIGSKTLIQKYFAQNIKAWKTRLFGIFGEWKDINRNHKKHSHVWMINIYFQNLIRNFQWWQGCRSFFHVLWSRKYFCHGSFKKLLLAQQNLLTMELIYRFPQKALFVA